mgnify:FL=1
MRGADEMQKFSIFAAAMVGAIACGILAPESASAATLTVLTGEVFLSNGQGYQAVSGQINVEPADCLLINPGGSAEITYDDGAIVKLGPGSTMCVGTSAADQTGHNASSIAAGDAGPNYMMLGLVGVGVIGGAIALSQGGGSDHPSSP